MRDDIVGMLKNAIERGGRPEQIAQSLVNSGYNAMEVQQALSFVTGGTLSSLNAPPQSMGARPLTPGIPQQRQPFPTAPSPPSQYVQYSRPLPMMKQTPSGPNPAKLILLIFTLLILVGGLVTAIIFKDKIIDFFG